MDPAENLSVGLTTGCFVSCFMIVLRQVLLADMCKIKINIREQNETTLTAIDVTTSKRLHAHSITVVRCFYAEL